MAQSIGKLLLLFMLLVLLIVTIAPIVMMLFLSLKDDLSIMIDFWAWPDQPKWSNYSHALEAVQGSIGSSVYVGGLSVIGSLFLGSLSGYVFARHRFRGKMFAYLALLSVLMVPSVLNIVPLYYLISKFGLSDTYWALILPYVAFSQVFAMLLFRSHNEQLPEELFEAARVDGGSEFFLYRRIALPLSLPILVTVGIVTFLAVYNDYIWPLIVLSDSKATFTVAAVNLTSAGKSDVGLQTAAFVIGSVPTLLILLFGMRYYVEGMTTGAVKV